MKIINAAFTGLLPILKLQAKATSYNTHYSLFTSIDPADQTEEWQKEHSTEKVNERLQNNLNDYYSSGYSTGPDMFKGVGADNSTCGGECFELVSNVSNISGNCIVLTIGATCVGYDPLTCEFFDDVPHARMKGCAPFYFQHSIGNDNGYNRMCYFYNGETGQIYTSYGTCLTLVIPDANDYDDECNACETMSNPDYVGFGGVVVTYPCVDGGAPFQSWSLDKGLIQSNCAHGMYLVDVFPMMAVSNEYNYEGSLLLTFGEEHVIPMKMTTGGTDIARLVLGDTIADNLENHGCWCSRLSSQEYSGGYPIDPLDEICKAWVQSKKCLKQAGGSCFGESITGTYTISQDKNECPWTSTDEDSGDLTCGELDGHLNPIGCVKDQCLIDLKYTTLIKKHFDENETSTWTAVVANDAICHPCPGCNDEEVNKVFVCEGVMPDIELVVKT